MIPYLQAVLGDMIGMAEACAIVFGIMKLIEMTKLLTEMKDVLGNIERNTSGRVGAGVIPYQRSVQARPAGSQSVEPQSVESMLRAIGSDPIALQEALYGPEPGESDRRGLSEPRP